MSYGTWQPDAASVWPGHDPKSRMERQMLHAEVNAQEKHAGAGPLVRAWRIKRDELDAQHEQAWKLVKDWRSISYKAIAVEQECRTLLGGLFAGTPEMTAELNGLIEAGALAARRATAELNIAKAAQERIEQLRHKHNQIDLNELSRKDFSGGENE